MLSKFGNTHCIKKILIKNFDQNKRWDIETRLHLVKELVTHGQEKIQTKKDPKYHNTWEAILTAKDYTLLLFPSPSAGTISNVDITTTLLITVVSLVLSTAHFRQMMGTTAAVGLNAGKRMLSPSFYYSDLMDKLSYSTDHQHHQNSSSKNVIAASKKTVRSFKHSRPLGSPPKALKECLVAPTIPNSEPCTETHGPSVEAVLLLQKSMLEKQLDQSFEKELCVTSSGIPARLRRMNSRKRSCGKSVMRQNGEKFSVATVSPDLIQNHLVGYVKGFVSKELLTHAQVVNLSRKIRIGLSLDEHRSRLKEKLGCEPSDDQLAMSLRMDRAELKSKLTECDLAREKLAMSNVRLVMSIAQRYDNMGANMADLVQAGLIGLLRGIEKFDSSKGFKISTYVYWWIRQGVCKALMENSRTLRLPIYLHERLSLIRGAKNRLGEKGIDPSINKLAETLNMSHKKIKNATEAVKTVLSLDREPFPSLNGLPGQTYHNYIADNRLENNPWHGVDEWALKIEVSNLMDEALRKRERYIIRLYYGLDDESLNWEEISKRMGLSRERVRQVGHVALEKLKYAARKKRMGALLQTH